MYAATGGPNVKGGNLFQMEGGRAPMHPPLATALHATTNRQSNNRIRSLVNTTQFKSCMLYVRISAATIQTVRNLSALLVFVDARSTDKNKKNR